MWSNYFKTAFRNLVKTKLYSTINILGLSIGMAACLLILHYVTFEKSYDRHHQNGERIYRLRYERSSADGSIVQFASCTPPAAPLIRERYPEVEKIARLVDYKGIVSFSNKKFTEEHMYYAEPDIFDIFSFKFIHGDASSHLKNANNAFISSSIAEKYFGNQDPIGKTFTVDQLADFQVTGVFEDVPANSHLKCEILLSYENLASRFGPDITESWGHTGFYTYLRLKPETDAKTFEKKLEDLVESIVGDFQRAFRVVIRLKMQPLLDIHLTSHFMQEFEVNGNRDSVNFLFIIALFIILMAWVNYINLSTARALTRAKEVGLRKVVGASRNQLMVQFFCEILLINLAAILFSMIMVKLALPLFSQITGTPMEYSIWTAGWFWLAVLAMFVAGVFLSGLYPVAVLSSFRPVEVLKGKLGHTARGINLRKILVVFQFLMAFILITGTLAVYLQLNFMKTQDVGFDMNQVLVCKAPRVRTDSFPETLKTFRTQLLNQAGITNFTVSTEVPGRQILWDAGGIMKFGESETEGKNYQIVGIDYDFVPFYNLTMVSGRNFSRLFPADSSALILNETAIHWMGFANAEEAVGQRVSYWGEPFTIVGVMKDFHQQSLKAAFEPHIFRLMPEGRDLRGRFSIRINSQNTQEMVNMIQKIYERFFPDNPFEYFFLDDYYNQQYVDDERFGTVFGIFAFLAVFVTSLGILGLSSFMTVSRTKEVGIRKVMGAEVTQILFLLTKDFMILLLSAFAVSLPLSYLAIRAWLTGFAAQMSLSLVLFVAPLLLVTLITLLTIMAHVVKAALANPILSLRYE